MTRNKEQLKALIKRAREELYTNHLKTKYMKLADTKFEKRNERKIVHKKTEYTV